MAQIFFNSFRQKGTLALWALVVTAQYMVGSNCLLVASHQIFTYSHDCALPFSSILSYVNKSTSTPIIAVWFVIILATLLGLLAFAGMQAIDAIFPLAINAVYITYSITITAHWLGDNDFKHGPFHLGIFSLPISIIAVLIMVFMNIMFLFPLVPSMSATTMKYTVVVLGGVLGLSLVWYYFPVYGDIHWFAGPVLNIGRGNGDGIDLDMQNSSGEKGGVKGTLGA
ncbi:hypothetical protein F5J12DRAFT_710180 [Pisolithus orientalis]|uniref:uncharacterized protein n=1 Tax=Pisolithus orientalis TaxID=936130 RepID=UPI002224A42C|nr:uncharacterized protein F5J12DRAFT_710180 [Pisolithus orientalis]KAI6035022.1 hypothetical protein F5J12DRAFT_710180 [Pisolithus orientalis]